MKKLRVKIAVALLSVTVCSKGTVFDYSYTFGSGDIVSGTLEGSQSGDFVNNVANVTVFFNGTAMSGNVYTARYEPTGYVAGPIVSFDVHKNDLLFANSDFANGDLGAIEFLQIINLNVYGSDLANAIIPGVGGVTTDLSFGLWSLTEQPGTSVPDAGSTAAMFGSALVGITLLKRKH
jgi:hypothetical protein